MKSITLKKEISIDDLKKYIDDNVYNKCLSCPSFNKNYSCPDFDYSITNLLNEYNKIIVYGKKFYLDEELKSLKFSSDILKHFIIEYTKSAIDEVNNNLIKLEEIIKDSNALFCSKCQKCDICLKELNQPCSFPQEAHYSLTSFKVNVVDLVKDLFNEEIIFPQDNNLVDYFIFVGGILKK